jgi:hypothetical protein
MRRDRKGIHVVRVWLAVAALALGACSDVPDDVRDTGAPCAWGLQCEGELCLNAALGGEPTGWTEGMCSRSCTEGACAAEERCTDLGDGLYCLPACAPGPQGADTTCREGYVCDPQARVCLPDCSNEGWQCPPELVCLPAGQCGPPGGPGPGG